MFPGSSLVTGEHLVPEGQDSVIESTAYVSNIALAHQRKQRLQQTSHCPDRLPVGGEYGRHGEVEPEELVGAIDQMDFHIFWFLTGTAQRAAGQTL